MSLLTSPTEEFTSPILPPAHHNDSVVFAANKMLEAPRHLKFKPMNIVQGLLSAISPLPDGDLSDRLNYCYTTTFLVIGSAFISGWSFVGQPIQCWFPAYYRGWWMEYALDYCYIQNTYFLAFTDMIKPDNYFDIADHIIPIPKNWTERDQKQIGYYQWVPFILALQALMFFLPVVVWRSIYSSTGVKVRAICETCSIKSNMEPEERSKNMEVVARFLIFDHDVTKNIGGRVKSMLDGRTVMLTYIFVKLLYALNALAQFVMVKWMLGTPDLLWGWTVLTDLVAGREWPETGNFPRVTLCDFSVRVLGNLHRHSVQCVLMINMFNEKIFIFFWFWFCFVAVFSLLNCLQWLVRVCNTKSNFLLINNYIDRIDPSPSRRGLSRKAQVRDFIERTLRPDGLLLIRMITLNNGDLITFQLVSTLWRDYQAQAANSMEHRRPPPYNEPVPLLSSKANNGKEKH
uniref:Innexin n=1 Tax=Globodera rostochiensis TaxID=31243 RepID=A0A914HH86_GLORO